MSQPNNQLFASIAAELGEKLKQFASVSGGSISAAYRLVFDNGRSVFVKHNDNVPADFFYAESTGLSILSDTGTLRIPSTLHCSETFIVMEFIESGTASSRYWHALGEGLAALHAQPAPCFGFEENNYCGSTAQSNRKTDDGHSFFAEQRLRCQAQMAFDSGKLPARDLRALETILPRLPELIPRQKPSLVHGDLWSGNVITDEHGQPVLIDPAAHWGWAEADLAMSLLFGGFDAEFYTAYESASDVLESDWRERVPLYNLYHLLNHLNLFGGGYYQAVVAVIARFK